MGLRSAKIQDSTTVSNTGILRPISSPTVHHLLHRSSSLDNPLASRLLASIPRALALLFRIIETRWFERKKHRVAFVNFKLNFEGWCRSFLFSIDLPEFFGKGWLSDFLSDDTDVRVRWDRLNFSTISDSLDSGFGHK